MAMDGKKKAGRKPSPINGAVLPDSPGRPPGVPNKATTLGREAIANFVDNNAERMQGWLDLIAEDPDHGPLVAFNCVRDLLEYHIPKLARTEVKVDGELKITTNKEEDAAYEALCRSLTDGAKKV